MNKLSTALAFGLVLLLRHQAMATTAGGMPAAVDAKATVPFPATYRTDFQYPGS